MNVKELEQRINEGRVVNWLEIKSFALLDWEIILGTTCGIDISLICDTDNFYFWD